MTNKSNKMKNVFFLLLCIHFLLAKDIGNLKKYDANILIGTEEPTSDSNYSRFNNKDNTLGSNLSLTTNSPNSMFLQFSKELSQIGKMSHEIEKTMEVKNSNQVQFTPPKDQVEKLRLNPTDMNNIDSLIEKLKLNLEFMISMCFAAWSKLKVNESDSFPFTKGTQIHKLYITAFPFVIVLTLFIGIVIVYKLVTKGMNSLLKKENVKSESEIKGSSSPKKRSSNPDNDKSISLKGRVKKVPKPINYKELFGGVESINNINQLNKKNTQQHEENCTQFKQVNKNEESFCSIDEFFDKVNLKQSLVIPNNLQNSELNYQNFHVKESENLIVFEDFDFKLPVREEIKEMIVEPKESKAETHFVIAQPQPALETIKEERDVEELDEHTIILNRLISNNYIQRTAITNCVDNRKNSK